MRNTAGASASQIHGLESVPTEFVEAAGITFAYRTLGTPRGTPWVLLQHFTGHMDSWDPEGSILRQIGQPVLVACGSDDTMLPDRNAYLMFKHLKTAHLVLSPDSGHGALFQYHDLFVSHVSLFLTDGA